MAALTKSRQLFAFTSPRTIEKIIPEIELLVNNFTGQKWDKNSQISFYQLLTASDFFEGGVPQQIKDGMASRDRINRAPKALGFVKLYPTIELTDAGKRLISYKRTEEVITRQLIKFQLPSPYHTQSANNNFQYNIRPYLELLRLIRDLGSITKFEIATFFLSMIDYNQYESVLNAIIDCRKEYDTKRGQVNYKEFQYVKQEAVVIETWSDLIEKGLTKTRESDDDSLKEFVKTKIRNMKDYSDAFFRYIRATGLVSLEKRSYRIIIAPSKVDEVDFILYNTPRDPLVFLSLGDFEKYHFDAMNVALLHDDMRELSLKLESLNVPISANDGIDELKDKLESINTQLKNKKLDELNNSLKLYDEYDDVVDTFYRIKYKDIIDAPLMFEYNTWRAMSMIDHAVEVKGNFITDSELMPLSTAGGKKADIEILYKDFGLIVEVTTATGSKQYEMEGEPVARHYGTTKDRLNIDLYCLFIATSLNDDSVAHMFITNKNNTRAYGGKTKIIPLNLDDFLVFLETAKNFRLKDSDNIKNWLETMWQHGQNPEIDEVEWRGIITTSLPNWNFQS